MMSPTTKMLVILPTKKRQFHQWDWTEGHLSRKQEHLPRRPYLNRLKHATLKTEASSVLKQVITPYLLLPCCYGIDTSWWTFSNVGTQGYRQSRYLVQLKISVLKLVEDGQQWPSDSSCDLSNNSVDGDFHKPPHIRAFPGVYGVPYSGVLRHWDVKYSYPTVTISQITLLALFCRSATVVKLRVPLSVALYVSKTQHGKRIRMETVGSSCTMSSGQSRLEFVSFSCGSWTSRHL